MFLETTSLVMLIVVGAYVAHEVTTSFDVGYAAPRRNVSATEQRIHDFMTAIPLALVLIFVISHPGPLLAWVGMGDRPLDLGMKLSTDPPPLWFVVIFLACSGLNALAYAQELVRCVLTQHRTTEVQLL